MEAGKEARSRRSAGSATPAQIGTAARRRDVAELMFRGDPLAGLGMLGRKGLVLRQHGASLSRALFSGSSFQFQKKEP